MSRVMCGGGCKGSMPRRRDKRIVVQRLKAGLVPDSAGHVDKDAAASWETYATRWANVVTKGSREFERQKIVIAEATHAWEVDSDTTTRAITTADRIAYDGRIFDIVGAIDVNEGRAVVSLMTSERQS